MATTITGPIKSVGGDLSNGSIEFRSPGLRESSAGDALINQAPFEVDVVEGAFTASLEPGPVNVILRLDGITKTLQNIVIPDSGTHTFHSVVTDSVMYAPTVVSAAVTARNVAVEAADRAEAVAEVQDEAIAEVVAGGETKAVLDAAYAPVSVVTTVGTKLNQSQVDARVTAVGDATYAPQSGTGSPAAALTTATGRAIAFAIALG